MSGRRGAGRAEQWRQPRFHSGLSLKICQFRTMANVTQPRYGHIKMVANRSTYQKAKAVSPTPTNNAIITANPPRGLWPAKKAQDHAAFASRRSPKRISVRMRPGRWPGSWWSIIGVPEGGASTRPARSGADETVPFSAKAAATQFAARNGEASSASTKSRLTTSRGRNRRFRATETVPMQKRQLTETKPWPDRSIAAASSP